MIEENKSSMKNSVRRLIIAGVGVLIQIIWVVVLVMRLNQYSQIITLLTVAIELVLVLAVYSMDTNAAFKLPWIILITVAPIVGICVFFLFGRSGATKKVRARYRKFDQQLFAYLNQDEQIIDELSKKDERLANDFKYLWKCASSPVYKNTDVKYYGDTCDAMAAQLEDMMQAKKFIFLEYHAIEMAEKLKEVFHKKGYTFFLESPTNQQFIILENEKMKELSKNVEFGFWEKYDDNHTVVRFATSWSTDESSIDQLEEYL